MGKYNVSTLTQGNKTAWTTICKQNHSRKKNFVEESVEHTKKEIWNDFGKKLLKHINSTQIKNLRIQKK